MSKTIVSSTDTEAEVQSALGNAPAAVETTEETPELVAKPTSETPEASETTDEPDPENEDETELEAKDDKDKKPRKKSGFERRIQKKNAEIEFWKSEALKKGATETKTDPAPAKPAVSTKPKADDFESHEEFVEALTDWKVDQKTSAEKEASKKESAKSEEQRKLNEHIARVEKLQADKKVTKEQWTEAMEQVSDIPMSLTVQSAILDSEDSAQLMLELVKDPDEYERICKLPHDAANRAIGRIEARLEKAATSSTEVKPNNPKAPKPLTPVKGKTASSTKSPDQMSFQEYKAWRAENPNA